MLNCILCLNLLRENNSVSVTDLQDDSTTVADIIKQHFWFSNTILGNSYLNAIICKTCWMMLQNFHTYFCAVKLNYNIQDQIESINNYESKDQNLAQDEHINDFESNYSSEEVEFENVEYLIDSDYSNKFTIEEFVIVPENQPEIFDIHQNEKFISISNRKKLLDQTHLNPDEFKCQQCDKVLKCSRSLNNHFMNCHSDNKPFQCDHCGACFLKKNQLTAHMKTHALSLYEYPCQYCSKTFNTSYRLTAHNLSHEPSKFVCEICSKELQSKFSLAFHVRTVHSEVKSEDRIKCEKCSHFLKNLESYKKHMRRHKESEQDNICPYCNKNAPNVDALRKHIKFVHESIKNLKCNFCEKRFVRPQEQIEHEATHTGQALYICSFCPKTFKSSANMHAHRKKIHSDQYQKPAYMRDKLINNKYLKINISFN